MLAPAVAAVDDRHGRPLRRLVRRALLEVADRDDVRVELQHVERVLDRLLVEVAGAGHLRVGEPEDVPAEAMHGGLVGESRPRAGLVEGRQQGLVLQQVGVAAVAGEGPQVVGDLEDPEELVPAEILEGQDVPAQEAPHQIPPLVAWWECRRRCAARVTGWSPGAGVGGRRTAPVKRTATFSSGWIARVREQVQEAGEAGRPGVIDVDAGRRAGQRVRLLERRLGGDERPAAARQHAGEAGSPVVRLVVDDAVRDAVRLLLPGPHEGRAVAGGVREDLVGRLACRDARSHALEGTGQRVDGRRLHRVDPRQRGCRRSRKPAMTDESSAPPPTWTTTRSRRGGPPGAPTAAASSQPSVSPPSIARPFRLPWQVNGTAPASTARRSAWYVGSPATPGSRSQTVQAAPRARRRSTTTGSASGGMKTSRWRSGGAGDDRSREGGVAAGGDRERRPFRRRAAPPRGRRPMSRRRSRDDAPPPPRAPAASRRGGGPCASPRRCRSRP